MGFITLKGHFGCNMKGRRERAEAPAKCAVRSLVPSPRGRLMGGSAQAGGRGDGGQPGSGLAGELGTEIKCKKGAREMTGAHLFETSGNLRSL